MSTPRFEGQGLISRRLSVQREDIAWVRYVVEAHEGLASLHIASDGELTLISTIDQSAELDALIRDLVLDLASDPSS